METIVGCCGYGFFNPKQFFGDKWKQHFASRLQAYAALFNLVEINSTFYKLPMLKTAEKWRSQALSMNKNFAFTVKCNQITTHKERFKTKSALYAFKQSLSVAKKLKASIVLIQTPASFTPTEENIEAFDRFMSNLKTEIQLAWEPRGEWLKENSLMLKLCKKHSVVHAVDLLRNEPVWLTKARIGYFRLHGFGSNIIYNYKFSERELSELLTKITKLKPKKAYVLFNNYEMFSDALRFSELIKELESK